MGRYLCQLCYTIVNYGENHPCFAYKNDDIVYTLPERSESNEMNTKHSDLTKNSNDNSVIIFPEEQQNDAENPEQINRCLTESHRQFSLRDASKTRGRSNCFSRRVCNTEQGNPSNTLLLGPLFNVHSRVVHSTENQTACLLNSSENFECAYGCQVDIRGASKSKSRRPVRWERKEGKKTYSTSSQAAANEKCETSHDEGFRQPFTEDEACFSKSLENASQKSQFHSKNVSAAPNFLTDFALPARFIETGQDVIKVSGDDSYCDAHSNSNTSLQKSSTCIYKGRLRSENILVSTGFSERNGFVPEQMLENINEEAQHKSITERDSKGINKRSNVSAENAISLASISDADPIAGSSRMNVESQLRTEHGNFICPECGKSVKSKSHLVEHYRTHTGEKPFPCDKCNKRFSTKYALSTHLRTHTGEKPYSCDQCDKRFSTKSDLNRHSLTHTGEKPYECPICKKAFTTSSNLRFPAMDRKCPFCGRFTPPKDKYYCFGEEEEDDRCLTTNLEQSENAAQKTMKPDYNPLAS
ncbi:Zinc finger protein 84 [Araneus ventricosus]|uniref:Zinc finger protein 84 n=1 Tax=Araneus ventricosus TaxID=182803 RepID=A0A4Y2SMQ7_ARAVE|nr:Zinc finger protein 84 [Araneus ventricosus]